MSSPPLDLLAATAAELQSLLARGTLTTTQLVEACLAQIAAHNHAGMSLHAVAATAPAPIVLARARFLDQERAQGGVRGPLHGIPAIVKDAIVTGLELGMPTQAGAAGLTGAVGKANAPVIQQMLDAGMVVLAKANMTEFCGLRADNMAAGYSAAGGQTQSPYIRGGRVVDDGIAGHTSPGGSSSGSAAGVAAGFAPLGVATETMGSLVLPANRAGLFGLRLTEGAAPDAGVQHLIRDWDTLGPVAKGALDVADLAEVMMKEGAKARVGSLREAVEKRSFEGLRVGFVEFEDWLPLGGRKVSEDGKVEEWSRVGGMGMSKEDKERIRGEYLGAMEKLRGLGAEVVHPLDVPFKKGIEYEGHQAKEITDCIFHDLFEEFTSCLTDPPVRTLAELVDFNKTNPEKGMPEPYPDQKELLIALENTGDPKDAKQLALNLRKMTRDGLAEPYSKVDIVVAPSDCMLAAAVGAAGYCAGVVPMGYLTNDQPQGLTIAARDYEEAKLLQFMGAFEANFPKRRVPPLLAEWQSG